ncbi:MAG: hypothetical protein FJ255_05430 [Phycisphaerae bacterium]|nr:hypothetical protein [Phycisphaerae bacterium]
MTIVTARDPTPSPRAYALVLAVVISAMLAAVIAIVVSRQSERTFAHVRALDRYRDHHLKKGLQEVLTAWLRGVANRSLADLLDDEGKAIEIDADERTFSVFFSDGQGTAITVPPAHLGANEQAALGRLLDELDGIASGVPLTRESGPLAISLGSAPEALIAAAIRALSPDTDPDPFVSAIVGARGRGLTQSDVEQAAGLANIPPEARPLLARFFTILPQLWRVDVEERLARGSERGLLLARHRGLIDLSPRTSSGRDRLAAGLEGGSLITEWAREAIETGPEGVGGIRLDRRRDRR